jgi:hypothetical protein
MSRCRDQCTRRFCRPGTQPAQQDQSSALAAHTHPHWDAARLVQMYVTRLRPGESKLTRGGTWCAPASMSGCTPASWRCNRVCRCCALCEPSSAIHNIVNRQNGMFMGMLARCCTLPRRGVVARNCGCWAQMRSYKSHPAHAATAARQQSHARARCLFVLNNRRADTAMIKRRDAPAPARLALAEWSVLTLGHKCGWLAAVKQMYTRLCRHGNKQMCARCYAADDALQQSNRLQPERRR